MSDRESPSSSGISLFVQFPSERIYGLQKSVERDEKNRKAFLSGSVAISEIQFCLEFERKSNFLRVTIIASLVLYIFTIGP